MRRDVFTVYGSGLAQGLALVSVPALATVLTDPSRHGLSSSRYGALFLPLILGAIAASSRAGALFARFGLAGTLRLGLLANLLSALVLAASRALGFSGLLLATTLLGVGFGTTLPALNTSASRLFPRRGDAALTALHALLGAGTAMAPALSALFTGLGRWWWLPLVVAALLAPPLALASSLRAETPPAAARRAFPAPFQRFALVAGVYGVCETLFGNWGAIYLAEEAGVGGGVANAALALFWAMVTLGRLGAAALSLRLPARRIYVALPALLVAALLAVPASGGAAGKVAAFAFAGLACSAFLPLSFATAAREMPSEAASVSGGLMSAYMIGFGVGSFGVGPLRSAAGVALASVYAFSALLAAALGLLVARLPRAAVREN